MEVPTAKGVLWAGHLMAVFGPHDTTPHHHAATQLAVGFDEPVRVRDGAGRWHRGRVLVARAGAEHRFRCTGRSVVAWADSLSTRSRSLLRRLAPPSRGVAVAGPVAAGTMAELRSLASDFDPARAVAAHGRLLGELGDVEAEPPADDPRVHRAAELLRAPAGPGAGGRSIPSVARSVGMSAARLRTLFRVHTGLPPSRYRIWWRMMEAARLLTEGWGVTDAAVTAGFADGAHLSRTFRRLTGIPPRFVTAPEVHFEVLDDRFVQDVATAL